MSVPQQTLPHQALYRSCIKEAAAQGRKLMERMVRRAALDMPQRAATVPDEAERKLLTEAARTLMRHEGALCETYPQALLAEFAQAISGDSARKGAVLSFDSLELMGDEQMQESVDLLRLQQAVATVVDAELVQLNALICAAQGLKRVQADRNPLRPEVYVRSLRAVILQSGVPHAVRSRWLHNLGDALGPELQRAYQELCVLLRSQGVVEAGFNVVVSPEDPAPAPARIDGSQGSTLLNVKELRRLLSGELDERSPAPQSGEGGPADFSVTVPAAFEVLQELKQVDQVITRLRRRRTMDPGHDVAGAAALHQQLQQEARNAGQALGLEVVNLMVENIAGDSRLLAPVQQAVRDLEPALLRLALGDPRFFNDRKHPARQLLEQMTQRSLAWQSVDQPGFSAFMDPLHEAVEALVSTRVTGAEPFDFAMKSLEEAWGDQQRRDRRYREKAVRALLQAEQRNLLADKIGKELRQRPDMSSAPREIIAFVLGPWSQVLAQARLSDESGAADPGGFLSVVSDMIWSAQPRMAASNTARLARLVPELQQKLRHGLATIDYPATAVQRFLDLLSASHRQAIRQDDESGAMPLSSILSADELESLVGRDEDDDSGPWLAPTEAEHSGFVETHQSIVPKPLFQQTQDFGDTRPGPGDLNEPSVTEDGLQPGAWVEMLVDGGWARYQVTWTSPHATLSMFANAAGKTHSMTRRLLDKMLKSGTMRLISGQAVIDVALDAVAQTALRNSLDIKL